MKNMVSIQDALVILAGVVLFFYSLNVYGGPPSIIGETVYVSSCKAPFVTWRSYDPARKKTLYLSLLSDGTPGRDGVAGNDLYLGDTDSSPEDDFKLLPIYPINTPLEFKISVDTGNNFYTGPAVSNPDNRTHADIQDAWIPYTTLINFEDDTSTFAYDDLSISASYTSTSETTEVCLSPDP